MKNVLITGGSRGIGKACVEKFAREGFSVSFIYNKSDERAEGLAKELGVFAIKADISSPDEARRACALAIEHMGSVDVLVNNAGVSLLKLFTDTTDEDYYSIINTNFGGAFFVTREIVRTMISEHFGRIVNIGSMWGKTGASCEVAYSASKAAIEGFTKSLAKELGRSDICVNCIEPGVVNTEMNGEIDPDILAELAYDTPVGRICTADEVAELVYLVATEKSGFLTGQIIGFDGGFAI